MKDENTPSPAFSDWMDSELEESLDDLFEMEFAEPLLTEELRRLYNSAHPERLDKRIYYRNLLRLQGELIKLHHWVQDTGAKVLIICEGRDAAGKGGVIKRIAQRLDPRVCRVVALPKPTEREQSQWYFQRYVPHLPAGGEIVWEDYTRAKEEMFDRTNIPEAPWYIVEGNDKKRERLNCIEHLLSLIPYRDTERESIELPERQFDPHYERQTLPDELYVPKVY